MDYESLFDRFLATYVRDSQGNLTVCTGPASDEIRGYWKEVTPQIQAAPATTGLRNISIIIQDQTLHIYEALQQDDGSCKGLVLGPSEQDNNTAPKAFEEFFAQLILNQIDFALAPSRGATPLPRSWATDAIVDLFDNFLRFVTKDDKWYQGGREYFTDRVKHYTSQGLMIEFCLPAFPCKSSNLDKVTGKDPDCGEELALTRLHIFVEEIEKIYAPGAKVWIISDGHVFSDCIGVDDVTVDTYGEKLKDLNDEIARKRGNSDRVGFKSLLDLFALEKSLSETKLSNLAHDLELPTLDHHVPTTRTQEAELCRQILATACQPPRSNVRAQIEAQHPAVLGLYRGFNKFMSEDLTYHPLIRSLSRKKRKNVFSLVAFEMMVRNQAYSNLVEMLFPNTVRLSIHSHNNAGPKFGIQLFDPSKVRAVKSLDPKHDQGSDNLHIPTPWHNCVAEMADANGLLLVVKAKVVRDALAAKHVELVDGDGPRSASFVIRRPVLETCHEPQETEDTLLPTAREKDVGDNKPRLLVGDMRFGLAWVNKLAAAILAVFSVRLLGRPTRV